MIPEEQVAVLHETLGLMDKNFGIRSSFFSTGQILRISATAKFVLDNRHLLDEQHSSYYAEDTMLRFFMTELGIADPYAYGRMLNACKIIALEEENPGEIIDIDPLIAESRKEVGQIYKKKLKEAS